MPNSKSRRKSSRPNVGIDVQHFTDLVAIGQGRTSIVYRARHIPSGKDVALKVSRSRDLSAASVDEFMRDTRSLGQMTGHPNVVAVYTSMRTDDNRLAVCLELCRYSLADRAATNGPMNPVLATGIGVKIAGALESAHHIGMTHNDVTPRNVLVRTNGQPALGDFGLARFKTRMQNEDGSVLNFSSLHVAPELLEGADSSVAADVYGLASTMYELIAGRAPFARAESESTASVALRILSDPARANDAIPAPLFAVIADALAKDPAARPDSAAEFADRLNTIAKEMSWPRVGSFVSPRDTAGVLG